MQFDEANRFASLRRGPQGNSLMTTTYTYIDDDRIERVEYGDGSSVNYTYDAARRLTVIDHVDSGEDTFLKLEYDYTADGLPASITETVGRDVVAVVEFTYDARRRLIAEVRTADDLDTEYDLEYEYDLGGNRTRKVDYVQEVDTLYYYDKDDVITYETFNNRLMAYETYDFSGKTSTLLATKSYYYNVAGNPTRIVTEQAVSPGVYSATRFEYARNGQTVTFVLGETWNEDDGDKDECPEDYTIIFAREFRYDGGRQRYLNREFDAEDLNLGTPAFTVVSETWTDYDGDEPYGDWTVSGSSTSDARSFELGLASVDPFTACGATNTKYFHADMIGTTRSLTASGLPSQASVYTAFGERIDGTNHRYGYVGAWGYQSHDEIPFLHVGARYYDPATGRFLQRDPIGVSGGANVYAYAELQPVSAIDPLGNQSYPVHPGSGWAPQPSPLPPGSPGWNLTPGGWTPKPPRIPVPPIIPPPVLACAAVAVVAVGVGTAVDQFVIMPWQQNNFGSNSSSFAKPHNPRDPWDWVQKGSSWEKQRNKWRRR